MGNIAQHEASSMPKKSGKYLSKRAFLGFRIGPAISPILKPCGPQLGPKLLPNGSNLPHFGAKLGRSWSLVGRSWPHVELMLRPCRIKTMHLDDVGPTWNMCKLPQSRALFGAVVRANMLPPELNVSLAVKLPCLGTFGAGGFLCPEEYYNVHPEVDFVGVVCYARISAIQLWNSENSVSPPEQYGAYGPTLPWCITTPIDLGHCKILVYNLLFVCGDPSNAQCHCSVPMCRAPLLGLEEKLASSWQSEEFVYLLALNFKSSLQNFSQLKSQIRK